MQKKTFEKHIYAELDVFKKALSGDCEDWVIKGFIDVYKNIYTISADTKVISKIIELLLFPLFFALCKKHGYQLRLSEHQNHYPDMTFISKDGTKFALDIKSTYKGKGDNVNGFTLGSFTGYFRKRKEDKNITFPYSEYGGHYVLGIIYSRVDGIDERKKYCLKDLPHIVSVIKDFDFLFHEKWKIASDKPGSGNTKNIGSIKNIERLINGNGTFANTGEKIFDDYWKNYSTKNMAKVNDSSVYYTNLEEYFAWRKI